MSILFQRASEGMCLNKRNKYKYERNVFYMIKQREYYVYFSRSVIIFEVFS